MWARSRLAGTVRGRIGRGCGVMKTRSLVLAVYLIFMQGMISTGRLDGEGHLADEVSTQVARIL